MTRRHFKLTAIGAIAVAYCATPAGAQVYVPPAPVLTEKPSRTSNFLDLSASVGYSGNPFLNSDTAAESGGSLFGRLTGRGTHAWRGEQSSTSISGFLEGTTYFDEYGVESIFAVDANHSRRVSERVSMFAGAGVSGDIAGQLSNRFLGSVPGLDPLQPAQPVDVLNPNLNSFSGHEYRVHGNAGVSIQTSDRGSVTFSAGAQHMFYSDDTLNDYTEIYGNIAYGHTVSERMTVGFSVAASHSGLGSSNDKTTTVTPAATISMYLSESWALSGSAGVNFTKLDHGLSSDSSTDFALNASLCKNAEGEHFCASVGRDTYMSAQSTLVTSTSANLDWSKRLDARQTIQLSAGYTHYDEDNTLLNTELKSDYYRAGASYSRRFNDRMSGGAELGARRLRQNGPDPDMDYSASLFLSYRLGDLG